MQQSQATEQSTAPRGRNTEHYQQERNPSGLSSDADCPEL